MDDPDLLQAKTAAKRVHSRTSKSDPRQKPKDKDPLLKFVANQVVSARQRLGITQDQLAEKAGCAPLTVTNVESGRRNVTLRSLSLLANALEIDVRDLFPPTRSASEGTVSEDIAKVILDSLSKITSAVSVVEELINLRTDQAAESEPASAR